MIRCEKIEWVWELTSLCEEWDLSCDQWVVNSRYKMEKVESVLFNMMMENLLDWVISASRIKDNTELTSSFSSFARLSNLPDVFAPCWSCLWWIRQFEPEVGAAACLFSRRLVSCNPLHPRSAMGYVKKSCLSVNCEKYWTKVVCRHFISHLSAYVRARLQL